MELTEGSIRTRSFSLRDIVKGFKRTSLDPLRNEDQRLGQRVTTAKSAPRFDLRFVVTLDDLNMS